MEGVSKMDGNSEDWKYEGPEFYSYLLCIVILCVALFDSAIVLLVE